MFRLCLAIICMFSGALTAQDLPCDHPDRIPLEIKMPNVFTPNDDGTNDLFRADYNIDYFTSYSLYVYNRAGQLIFFADRPAQGWDGRTPSGTRCPDGTYFYIAQYETDCERDKISGVVEIVR